MLVCAHAPPPVWSWSVVAGVGERGAELSPGVVQGLIERAAGARQALGEHVDRHAVERERREDLALVRRERGLHGVPDRAQQIGFLDRLLGARGAVGEPLPRVVLERDLAALPGAAARLHSGFEQHELVRPGREAAGAAERVELGEDRRQGVVRRLRREVVDLVARDVREKVASARELVMGTAQKQRVQIVDRGLARRAGLTQAGEQRLRVARPGRLRISGHVRHARRRIGPPPREPRWHSGAGRQRFWRRERHLPLYASAPSAILTSAACDSPAAVARGR